MRNGHKMSEPRTKMRPLVLCDIYCCLLVLSVVVYKTDSSYCLTKSNVALEKICQMKAG